MSPDQKDVRGHPDHHPGHGDHRRLRRVRVFPPQPIHRVGQVDCVGDVPQQTQHCQEKGQPAGDRTVLLHGERRFKKRGWSWIPVEKYKDKQLQKCLLCLYDSRNKSLLSTVFDALFSFLCLDVKMPDFSHLIIYSVQ